MPFCSLACLGSLARLLITWGPLGQQGSRGRGGAKIQREQPPCSGLIASGVGRCPRFEMAAIAPVFDGLWTRVFRRPPQGKGAGRVTGPLRGERARHGALIERRVDLVVILFHELDVAWKLNGLRRLQRLV